jgi:hypothetical protein
MKEQHMKDTQNLKVIIGRHLSVASLALIVFSLPACNSGKTADTKVPTKPDAAVTQSSTGPDVDLNCVTTHFQHPPESFHYTFTDDSTSNPWSEDADVTPQVIDGTFKSRFVPAPVHLHATPQEMPHQYQWAAIARLASTFALVRSTSAVVNEGAEKGVNGYDTTKLSIDTGRAETADQALYTETLGPGGFAKGTVWVTSDGCPVKMALDVESHSKDGQVSGKSHYEEAMLRK